MSLEKNIKSLTEAVINLTQLLQEGGLNAIPQQQAQVPAPAAPAPEAPAPAAPAPALDRAFAEAFNSPAPAAPAPAAPAPAAPAPAAPAPAAPEAPAAPAPAAPAPAAPAPAAPEAPAAPAPAAAAPVAPAPAAPAPAAYTPEQANQILIDKYHELVQQGADGAKVQAKLEACIGSSKLSEVPVANLPAVVEAVQSLTLGDVQ